MEISIHLMLMLIEIIKAYYLGGAKISIHLMLMLINGQLRRFT